MEELPLLQGDNITLRRPIAEDVTARLALGSDPHIHEMFGGSREQLKQITQADAEAWVSWHQRHPFAWVIVHKSLIGSIRLDRVDMSDRRASLAIGILHDDYLNRGLGSEALRLVLSYAFKSLGLHRVSVRVLAHNHRAIRAYAKCGFLVEGCEREAALIDGQWHDDVMLAILEHEFSADPPKVGPAQARAFHVLMEAYPALRK